MKNILLACLCHLSFICFGQQDILLKLKQDPFLEITSGKLDTTILLGDSITLGYNLKISGGTGNYSFSWMSDNFTEHSNSSKPSFCPADSTVYRCYIKDDNDCFHIVYYKVNVIFPLEVHISSRNISCNGLHDGSISLNIDKGEQPYLVNWSTGTEGNSVNNLGSGEYTLSVTDHAGQCYTGAVVIGEPEPLSVSIELSDTLISESVLKLIIPTVKGGQPPYTYEWPNGSALQKHIVSEIPDNYSLEITDSNGCTFYTSIKATDVPLVYSNHNLQLKLFPNPNTGQFEINISGIADDHLEIRITGVNGERIFHKIIPNPGSYHTEKISLCRPPGIYNITVGTLAKSKSISKTFIIQ
jgi:hypothetical protein